MTLQLTAADSAISNLLTLSGGAVQPFSYSPFGATASRTGTPAASVPGFNGERADPLTGVTHLGNGYRAYSPALQRFTAPDSESPFGVGGINPYAYCSSDPVNQRDPSGHGPLMWLIEGIIWGAAKLGKDLVLSEAAAAAVSTTESVIWGVSAAASVSTGIASAATRSSNPEVSAKLGWASLGLGITAASFGIPKTAGRIRSKRRGAHSRTHKGNVKYGRVIDLFQDNDIQYFTDWDDIDLSADSEDYVIKRRLNVAVHGEYLPIIDKSVQIRSGGKKITAEMIASELTSRFGDLSQYSQLRTIICHSAESRRGGTALGQKLANLTDLPVQSFKGSVSRKPGLPFKEGSPVMLITDGSENYQPVYFRPEPKIPSQATVQRHK